jgi:hypothetical protein
MVVNNPYTTFSGILALLTVLWHAYQTKTVNWDDLQTALVGLGLVAAKDWNVTGGSRIQD